MKRIVCLLLSMFMLMGLAGCSGAPAEAAPAATATAVPAEAASANNASGEPEPIKIALCTSLSGDSAENGALEVAGYGMAVEDINAAGGIQSLGGAKLELIIQDYTSSTDNTKNVVERVLADNPDVVAGVGGGTSGLLLTALPAWENNGVPIVACCNADALCNQGYKYIFSCHCRGSSVGATSVDFITWMKDTLGYDLNTAAIVYENSSKGISSAEGARKNIEKAGLKIVYDDSHPNTITDATALVTAVKATNADVVFIYTAYQVCKLIDTAMTDLNYHPIAMTGNSLPSFYESVGESANGTLVAANWCATSKNIKDNPAYEDIVERYEKEEGQFMEQTAGGSYSAMMVLAQAIEAAGSRDRAAIRDALASGSFESMFANSPFSFDETGANTTSCAIIGQWQDGHVVTIYPEHLATGEYIPAA